MDENHLYATVRYVERNPMRAKLCSSAREWQWSSTRAHISGEDDDLVEVRPMLDRIDCWEDYLTCQSSGINNDGIRKHTRTGRPAGDDSFIDAVETLIQRRVKKQKPGPKPGN